MLASVPSAILIGVHGPPISVEVHVSPGIPSFTVVGLPDASCREARDRVRAAILSSGLQWPQRRVTVNLAPTGVRKSGAGLDLPIAVALLAADGQLPAEAVADLAFIGELGLDGSIRRVPGVLPLVDAVRAAAVVVPAGCARGGRPRPPRVGPGRAEPPEPGRHRSRRGGLARSRPGRRQPPETNRVLPTWPTSGARRSGGSRWRWRPRAGTTCCWSDRPAPARRCSPSAFPVCCRRWT